MVYFIYNHNIYTHIYIDTHYYTEYTLMAKIVYANALIYRKSKLISYQKTPGTTSKLGPAAYIKFRGLYVIAHT